DDVAREVVQYGREIVVAPTNDLELTEVGLPQLIDARRWVLELIRRFDQHERGAGDEVEPLEDAIHARFREEIAFTVGDVPSQFTRRELGVCQGNLHHLLANGFGDPVPELTRLAGAILQPVY